MEVISLDYNLQGGMRETQMKSSQFEIVKTDKGSRRCNVSDGDVEGEETRGGTGIFKISLLVIEGKFLPNFCL